MNDDTTTTQPTLDDIGHLAFDPVCQTKVHDGDPTPRRADVLCIFHPNNTCTDMLLCTPCMEQLRQQFEEGFAAAGRLACSRCRGRFLSLEELWKVEPL